MVKTIIFDFDGTIADTMPLIFKIYNENAKKFGIPRLSRIQTEKIREMTAKEISKIYKVSLLKFLFIVTKMRKILNTRIDQAELFYGIKEMLKGLRQRGIKIGILSSNSQENIKKFLKTNDLMLFDFIHSELNIFAKARALKNLLRRHRLTKENVIYIGDEVRDIEACKKNGVKIIAVSWGFNKKEVLSKNNPSYMVDKPQEILKIVDKN